VPESLAISRVIDGAAVVAGDFRIDPAGLMRFAVFVRPGTGARRVGRIVQRLCEIETYRAMSMLGLMRSRQLTAAAERAGPAAFGAGGRAGPCHPGARGGAARPLAISADLEKLAVQFTFRFGATAAYEAILNQRIQVLREDRIEGRQTFAEFMMRRYDPAMRTVKSAEKRLHEMSERATRAAELLRTRVDVERSAQNQKLLESMDQRADLQLRLQRTVEGLSVVAISYYAVSLVAYAVARWASWPTCRRNADRGPGGAGRRLLVWFMVRRIRKALH
jgi:uncharacterized membrane-anchored protein